MMLDTEFVRANFPAVSDRVALFDNAGGSTPPRQVIERVKSYFERHPVQLGASYRQSRAAAEEVTRGRRAAADLIRAQPDEVVIGHSTTQNVQMLVHALRPWFSSGDEIIVTNLDHESNIGPFRRLEAFGVEIKEWRFDPFSCQLQLDELDRLLSRRTKLVCFTHCANVVGSIHDVEAIVQHIHDAGALACVDGVAFAPHRRVDVGKLGADFYLISLYKTFGPHLGLLYVNEQHHSLLDSQNHFFHAEASRQSLASKLEPGNPCYELAASLPGIIEYLEQLHDHHSEQPLPTRGQRIDDAFDRIATHEEMLAERLLRFLRNHSDLRIVGETSADQRLRVATIGFVAAQVPSSSMPEHLDALDLAVRHGHFYAHRAIQALGLPPAEGIVRVSMAHYNTLAEVDRLVAALETVLGK